jgi:hypothetical protein
MPFTSASKLIIDLKKNILLDLKDKASTLVAYGYLCYKLVL